MQQLLPVMALSLLACAGHVVPDDALSQVPAERVQVLGAIQDELSQVEVRLAETRDAWERTGTARDAENLEFYDLSDQLVAAQTLSVAAVKSGDAELAKGAETSVDALDARVTEGRLAYLSTDDQYSELGLEVDMLEAETKSLSAHLGAERARAAVEGGADLKIAPYERRERSFGEKYQEARQEWLASLEPAEREAAEAL